VRTSILAPGDEAALEAFLQPRSDSSLFLRANVRAAGLADTGAPLHGTYAAAWDDAGAIVAVAACSWTGMLLLQSPDVTLLPSLTRLALERSRRAVAGLAGPWDQIVAARAALGLDQRRAELESRDDLFALELAALRVPRPLADGECVYRRALPAELPLLSAWRAAYHVETLGARPGPETDARARAEIEGKPEQYLLAVGGEPVAFSAFNAQLPDVVQVGGVYTPPSLRGRGYGRAVVAGALLRARAAGASRAVLFTGEANLAAQRAYRALGFERVGDYGLVLF
jgi:ribosomal protein S18 acetylase RimI-like enzyme